jgi:hypothetical protein
MMFIRSLADFNGTPWAVQVTVGAITVTAQATSSPDRHDKQGSGYLAINGDYSWPPVGTFTWPRTDDPDRRFGPGPLLRPGYSGNPLTAKIHPDKGISWEEDQ